MEISEKDLEDLIWEATQDDVGLNLLFDRGLITNGTLFRQVGLGNYGVADIVGVGFGNKFRDEEGNFQRNCLISIYELKKGDITLEALCQALRYKDGITYFLTKSGLKLRLHFEIHLIGRDIDMRHDLMSVARNCGVVHMYQYYVTYDGIHFKHHSPSDYSKADPGKPSPRYFNKRALYDIMNFRPYYGYKEG